MPHSPLKKPVVAMLLAAYLAASVVQVPMVFANSFFTVEEKVSEQGLLGKNVQDARDLVAVVVDEETWENGDLKSRIERYAEDIQQSLPKTNTLIIPASRDAKTVVKLQEVLQKLHLQGEGDASLVGVVVVGDVPLPVVNRGSQAFISMLPYTDFVDPSYVFDAEKQAFVRSVHAPPDPKPEIWHGVIRPPKSHQDAEKQLVEFFDKNHRYHSGDKEFSQFQKKILIADLVREERDMNRESFPRYRNFLKNMEDIAYSRFSAKWLTQLQKEFDREAGLEEGLKGAERNGSRGTGLASAEPGGHEPAGAGLPDIQSRQPIMQFHLQYPELFGTFFSTIADFVVGSGRYREEDVESLPALIARQDLFVMQTLKSTNDAIEAKIDEQLEKIQKSTPLYSDMQIEGKVKGKEFLVRFMNNSIIAGKQYVNGLAYQDITHAQQCSMYGGTSSMVRFLRSLNPLTVHVSSIGGDSKANPKQLPSLGAMTKINPSGATIVDLVFGGVPLERGDVLLDIDRVSIDGARSLESILDSREVGENVSVHLRRPSVGKEMTLKFKLLDANNDALVAGCYGMQPCFPQAATVPVDDHGGTARVSDTSVLSAMDLGRSCNSLASLPMFADFLEDVQTFLDDRKPGDKAPSLSQNPADIVLLDEPGRKFTLQDFLDLQGVMNVKDDNGDYYDTNGNGKVDQSDFGVDDPSELAFGYKPAGKTERQRFDAIQRDFLLPESPRVYSTPNADIWIRISPPSKYKDISSVAYHKEPTAETLGAQYKAIISAALPIDKPRFAEFTDRTGGLRSVIYPNIFEVSSYEDFVMKLKDMEKHLAIFGAQGEGYLARDLDEKTIRPVLEWRGLSLEAKHMNTDSDYEAMYFVSDGTPTYATNNFSGDGFVDEDDDEYLGIVSGETVRGSGTIVAKPGVVTIEPSKDMPSGNEWSKEKDGDVDIRDWFPAVQKWLSGLKHSFQPVMLNVNDGQGVGGEKQMEQNDVSGDDDIDDTGTAVDERAESVVRSLHVIGGTKRLATLRELGSVGPSTSTTLLFSITNASDTSIPVSVRITERTAKYGDIITPDGKTAKQAIIYAQNGSGAFTLSSTKIAGSIHVVLCSPAITCSSFEIMTSGFTSQLDSSSLYASLLGGPFGKISEPNYLAGNVLFQGKTQAVASITSESSPKRRVFSLGAYGKLSLYDPAASATISTLGGENGVTTSLFSDLGKTKVGTLFIAQQAGISIVPDFASVAGKAGVFVLDMRGKDSRYSLMEDSKSAGTILLKDGNRLLANIYASGGIKIFDHNVRLVMSESSGTYFGVDIFAGAEPVARSQIQFDAVNSVALLNTLPSDLHSLPPGVWLINEIRTDDLAFESSYTGYSSRSPSGYALVNTLLNETLGTSQTSLEDALTSSGIGFSGDNKHMLLLASGNTVGVSHLSYPSEIGIVLGDPTVRLPGSNDRSEIGFTRDLGQHIGVAADGADVLLPIDVNGDSKKDLLVAGKAGKVRYFQYVGGESRFRDRGIILDAKHGILDAAVADADGDDAEDIVIAARDPCTKKESCLDVYLNKNGYFVRQNIGLQIAKNERISVLRILDLNLDGRSDLLVSLTGGVVNVFYATRDGFSEHGQLIGDFDAAMGQKLLLTAGVRVAQAISSGDDTSVNAGARDEYPDILVQLDGSSVYFVSDASRSLKGGNVSYTRLIVPVERISQEDASKKLHDDLAKSFAPQDVNPAQSQKLGVKPSSLDIASGGMDILMEENGKDANGNGTPDYLDTLPGRLDEISVSVAKTIEKLRCSKACFPMPINFAFLAPGQINLNGKPVGYDPGLPLFGAIGSCANWPIWPVCPYTDKAMNFRLYVSPTTTGQVGFGICVGAPYPQNGAQGEPGARCYAFAPNISLIPKGLCKAVSDQMSSILKRANSFGTGTGFTSLVAGGGKNFVSTDTRNSRTVIGNSASDLLTPYKAEINVATNIRVPGFPKTFTDWLDRQIEEVSDKLGDLPDIIVKYPQLSSFGRAFVPTMPSGNIKSYSTFLAYLNSIPLITIDPKPITLVVPTLTSGQISKFQADLDRFKEDFLTELLRVKELFGCSKPGKDKRYVDLCASIDVKANEIFTRIARNYEILTSYQDFPQKILEYRNLETKYVGQIINYLDTVTNFVGGYVKRQQKRLSSWISAVKAIRKTLASWQAVVDLTQKYAKNCDNCKTDRNSLFPLLLSTFVKMSEPPIIEFPKWPDIVLDFSRVELGTRVAWPDLSFKPKQILLPRLPSVKLPISAGMLTKDTSTLRLDLDSAFAAMIPSLPELPELPAIPKLPDLPPLPAFALPDLPPAPKIPSLNMIKGVDLKKSLGTFKRLLQIVCLVKKGYVVVNENSLKTEIEALTQRSVVPPLKIDLSQTVSYPPIKYNAVDQILIQGKMKFELETDAIYNFFKQFADSVNSITTDLVNGVNAEGKKISHHNLRSPSRYLAQAGQSDSAVPTPITVAQVDGGGGTQNVKQPLATNSASATESYDRAYREYAESQSQPLGLYIQNPKTGLPERLIDYTLELSRDPHIADSDVDGDNDSDIFYNFGGDIYFKENLTSSPDDEFTEFDDSDPSVKSLDKLMPVVPAPYGITVDDSQAQSLVISWNTAGEHVGGYEVVYWNQDGLARKRYLYESAGGKIRFDESVPVEKIARDSSQTIALSLPQGNTFFQILPLGSDGRYGTPSEVRLLAPQVCGNTSPPLVSFGDHGDSGAGYGSATRSIAVLKPLLIDMSNITDLKSSITGYFADLNLDFDSNHDGDSRNDRDVMSSTSSITLGPFLEPLEKDVRVFAENASGLIGGQVVHVQVYVPDITLKDVILREGRAYGFTTPGEAFMPFSLVRERAGQATILGDYQTDSHGNFSVSDLSSEGATVIRNAKHEIVAEYDAAIGSLKHLREGYSLRAVVSDLTRLPTIQLVDSQGVVLADLFRIPDANTDANIDPPDVRYTPSIVNSMRGVHLQDLSPGDGIEFKKIPANDPEFFGGVEIIDRAANKRIAVIDSASRVYVLDSRLDLGLKAVDDGMPYLFEFLFANRVIGQMYVASPLPKSPTVLDSKEFSVRDTLEIVPISTVPATTFSDVPTDSPYYDAVNLLKEVDIIEGYRENGKTLFKPEQNITRAEFTKIVLTSLCIEPRQEAYNPPSPFYDIAWRTPLDWFYPYVKESFLRSLITGYLGEKDASGRAPYRPDATISRAEAAKILIEALRMLDIIFFNSNDALAARSEEPWYTRYLVAAQDLSAYLRDASRVNVKEHFIITSDESRTPNYEMTRGDFAVMAARVLTIADCYRDERAKRRAEQERLEDEARRKAQREASDAEKKGDTKRQTDVRERLKNKISQLPSGIYLLLPDCNTCPCISSIVSTGQLLPGDTVFAIFSTLDHSRILRKSNTILLSKP